MKLSQRDRRMLNAGRKQGIAETVNLIRTVAMHMEQGRILTPEPVPAETKKLADAIQRILLPQGGGAATVQ